MPGKVKTIAVLTARSGKADALRKLLEQMVEPSRAEPGNLRYDLWVDPAHPGRFVLDELYVDRTAVEAHHATPHFQDYLAQIPALAERSVWSLDEAAVA
ncbi:antibiotic biosynthesis monooxygenase [Caulobacter segnis]|uniref:Antibiotic biosynthesis monooxygenase n=2 Tax=Caulobacter segnis TaxID=88688 RepID=D5VK63_CAUST|nr:putative quinol monooxygenase [Caulobacter segnis]ADG10886.1 Antibiotic biosynthesis monooxygenase [Caulobacter segnis ATCC 21756]AVQ02584.1 antibiotic biosynthesis monooxygenase [Caulobacter segnis]